MIVLILFLVTFHQILIKPCYGFNKLSYTGEVSNNQESSDRTSQEDKLFTNNEEKIREANLYNKFEDNEHPINNIDNMDFNEIERNDIINNTKEYRKSQGCLKLKLLGRLIKNNINPFIDVQDIIVTALHVYVMAIDEYFESISKKNISTAMEKESVSLNVIETTNEIFEKACRSLFDTIFTESINDVENVIEKDLKQLSVELNNVVAEEKKEGLKFICIKTKVCKHIPAYSDHFVNLLDEIFPMADDKFLVFMKTTKDIVEAKVGFFKSILKDDIGLNISLQLNPILTNVSEGAKFISGIKDVIRNRFKLGVNYADVSQKIKAMRLFIEMVDKAFEALGPNLIKLQFDTVKMGIIDWKKGKRSDLEIILGDFINHFFDLLRYNWDQYTKDEVSVLVDVIMNGKSINKIIQEELFTEGSEFLKSNDAELFSLDVLNRY